MRHIKVLTYVTRREGPATAIADQLSKLLCKASGDPYGQGCKKES